MRGVGLPVVAALSVCSTAPNPPVPQSSPIERVLVRTVKEPIPVCQSGLEGSLVDGVVTIRPGEAICVHLETRGDEVVPTGVVTSADEATLVVRLWQEPGLEGNTFLSLHNPLDALLR